jgi:hypothetical protein
MAERDEQFADEELSRMLASIDHAAPPLRANEIIARARARSARRSALLAAAAVLMVATVATATVPGSFVRRYLQGLFDRRAHVSVASQGSDAAAADAASRGIAFAPGAQVDVDFRAEQSSGALQVRWADVPTVMLAQTGASGEAHYALTPSGVIVNNGGSTASYTLVFPRTVTRARVRIAGRVVFSKDADSVSCTGVRVDTGSCVIEVAAERPRAGRGAR